MKAVKAIIVVAVMFTSMFFRCGVSASTVTAAAATNANHSVGGASGWDLSSNLEAWATRTTFRVGDYLVFRYTPVHDVLEVRKMDYDLCHTIDPMETHNDGETVIPLRAAGNRYFICGRLGHCAMGLKLQVLVLPALQMSTNVNATSPSSPLITSPPNTTSPISNNNSSRHGPDDQVVGNDHVLPSPPPSASNYSINSTGGAPPDHATGNTATGDAHLASDSPRLLPLVTVIAALLISQLLVFASSSIPSWIAASIAAFVLFTHAALILLVAIITVVAAELLLTTRPLSDNNSRHGPDNQVVGNDHALPSPPPAASNHSINSTDDAPPDRATGNTTTLDAQLTAEIPWIQPLVTVVAALMIAQLLVFSSSSITSWIAAPIAALVLFAYAALFVLVNSITVVTAVFLLIISAYSDYFRRYSDYFCLQ